MDKETPGTLDRLRDDVVRGNLSRRDVLRRAAALGLSAPIIASLLAACGDEGDDDDTDADGDTGGADPTATEASEEDMEATEGDADAIGTSTDAGEEATESDATSEEDEGEATGTAGEEAPAGERGGGGEVRLLYWQAPTILNPHLAQGTKDFHAAQVCLEPLAYIGDDETPILRLATEWPSIENGLRSEDGRGVTWKLREGVTWHDGEPFTAEDVKFTYEYVSNPDTTATTIAAYLKIESVEVVDDLTAKVNFKDPNPAWFDTFVGGSGVILPRHILEDNVGSAARSAEFNLSPIGTGPWMVTEFRPGDVAIYDIFEDYWDPGKPFFDRVFIKGGGDAASAARAVLVTGEVDWAWNLQVDPTVLEQMEAEGGQGELVSLPGTSAERIMINFANPNVEVDGAFSEPETEHPIWSHQEAREALNLAIQRDVISEQLYGDFGQPTGDNLNVPQRFKLGWPWEYNLDKAREKLAAINFPDDFENTNLLYQTSVNQVRQKTQEIVKADLEQLGFTVRLKSVDSGVFFSSGAGNPDTYGHFYADIEMYTNGPSSPYPIDWAARYRSDRIAQQENSWSGENITRYANPEYDELHDQAQTTIDENQQVDVWTQMLTVVYEDIAEVPQVWRGGAAAVNNRIKNWSTDLWPPTPINDLKNWTT